jgi:hypothetical protein
MFNSSESLLTALKKEKTIPFICYWGRSRCSVLIVILVIRNLHHHESSPLWRHHTLYLGSVVDGRINLSLAS